MTTLDVRACSPPRRPPPIPPKYSRTQLAAALTWLLLGAAVLIGPPAWRTQVSYRVLVAIVPLRGWGGIFVAIGLAQLLAAWRHRPNRGLIAGAAVASAWAVGLVAAALVGRLTGFAGPILWAFLAVAQVLEAYDQHRRR